MSFAKKCLLEIRLDREKRFEPGMFSLRRLDTQVAKRITA